MNALSSNTTPYFHLILSDTTCQAQAAEYGTRYCAQNGIACGAHQGAVRTSSRGRAARKAAATARSWGAGRRSAVSQRSRHCGQLAGPDRSWYSMLLRTHPEQTAGTERPQECFHCLL